MNRTRFALALALVLAGCAAPMAAGSAPQSRRPQNAIVLIGDGVGVAYWTAARLAVDHLNVERFPVVGLVDTKASNSRVTDSAAGATAYASGVRTYNGAIGVTADTVPVHTVLELSMQKGRATGIVATSRINHATPAAFVAHVQHRGLYSEIASQIARLRPTVVLGGGRGFFDGSLRPDSQNILLPLLQHYTYVESAAGLRALDLDTVDALLGLLDINDLPPARERGISLSEMTEAALSILSRDRDGFFVMIEASQPDWRGHDNAELPWLIDEMLDFDRAIGVALEFQAEHPETLVLVLADHETGGLALHANSAGHFVAHYTTTGHTAEFVPLFASGPGAERFGGLRDNYVVGRILMDLMDVEPAPVAGWSR